MMMVGLGLSSVEGSVPGIATSAGDLNDDEGNVSNYSHGLNCTFSGTVLLPLAVSQ